MNRANLLLDTAPVVSSASETEVEVDAAGTAGANFSTSNVRANSKELKRRAQKR